MSLPSSKYHFSVAEFERMGKAGVFTEDAHLELIEGEIIEISPIDSRHAACVNFLSRFLSLTVGNLALVSTRNPIRLDDFSEPVARSRAAPVAR